VLLRSRYVETHSARQLIASGAGGLGHLIKERVSNLSDFALAVRRVGGGELVVDRLEVEQLAAPVVRAIPSPLSRSASATYFT